MWAWMLILQGGGGYYISSLSESQKWSLHLRIKPPVGRRAGIDLKLIFYRVHVCHPIPSESLIMGSLESYFNIANK